MKRRLALLGIAAAMPLGALAQATPRIRMFELYKPDMSFSDLGKRLAGQFVSIQGFMAPHLKVESDFFILSNTPVDTCPFCESEDQWIDTIIFVRMKQRQDAVRPGELIQVHGRLEIGPKTDPATGFVSRVRLADATFQRL